MGEQTELRAGVVIPVHEAGLTALQRISLQQCLCVLGRHPIMLATYPELDSSALEREAAEQGVTLQKVYFPRACFRSIHTYNILMMSPEFYAGFAHLDYILIYQLDAFVFRDELARFCDLGYDFVGAPWLDATHMRRQVGNGGFSLRKVSSARRVLASMWRLPLAWWIRWMHLGWFQREITQWITTGENPPATRLMQGNRFVPPGLFKLSYLNEDGFWGQNCDMLDWYRTAPIETALAFAFETAPVKAYRRNACRLPFGCHAWPVIESEFWRPHIERYGYDLDSLGP